MLLLEFCPRGGTPPPKPDGPTAFWKVELGDSRAGDGTDLHVSLGYPRALEAQFLAAFEALRKLLTLQDEE
jgi:hypothetical protein